jgi:hypothetical protein
MRVMRACLRMSDAVRIGLQSRPPRDLGKNEVSSLEHVHLRGLDALGVRVEGPLPRGAIHAA